MPETPDVGSPEWRYWVVAELEAIQRGDIADADIAAIIGVNGSATRAAINDLIADGDQQVTLALATAIEQSSQSTLASANRYANAAAGNALIEAKKYTDAHSGGDGGEVSKAYVDVGDANALQAAKNYADIAAGNVGDNQEDYTDSKVTAALATAKQSADDGDADTLRLAKQYTDAHSGGGSGGGGVSEQYVIDAVAQGVSDADTTAQLANDALQTALTTAITDSASATELAAANYTDSAVSVSEASVTGQAQTMANQAQDAAATYTDDSMETLSLNLLEAADAKDVVAVQTANAYTDQQIAALPSGDVNKAYVDAQIANVVPKSAISNNNILGKDNSGNLVSYAQTSNPTAGTIAARDASGRMQVNTPASSNDAATKAYVDGRTATVPGPWIAFSFGTGYTGNGLAYRIAAGGSRIEWKGLFVRDAGTFPAARTVLPVKIPQEAWPILNVRRVILFGDTSAGGMWLNSDGNVVIIATASATDTVYMGDVAYASA